jgi:hypothetical protein
MALARERNTEQTRAKQGLGLVHTSYILGQHGSQVPDTQKL